jgi:hypothetical protein
MEITKRAAKTALQLDTDAALARFFGVGRWAVGQWPEDEALPDSRQWELRAKHPELFPLPVDPLAQTA